MSDNTEIDYEKLNKVQRYLQYAVFQSVPGALANDRTDVIEEARAYFQKLADAGLVEVRGLYNVSGSRADADFMVWWHAEEFDQIQDALNGFRRTTFGQSLEISWLGNGVHRPSEFNKRHLPSFIMGEEPKDWITVYPFVRTFDWYLLDPEERSTKLRDHGMAAAEFADIRANTVAAFALGDYEWMLSFEADELGRIVDLMHKMRYTEARLHVREETPFISGRRVADVGDAINALP